MTDKLLPDIIQPEGLEVAEAYLELGGDSKAVAVRLGLPAVEVEKQLKTDEVKSYINRQFNEVGFRNKFRTFGLMDQIINMKIAEMEETGVGSAMDIMDILKVQHKMQMDVMKAEADLVKAQNTTPGKQVNVQVNNGMAGSDDSNYMQLLNTLVQ